MLSAHAHECRMCGRSFRFRSEVEIHMVRRASGWGVGVGGEVGAGGE